MVGGDEDDMVSGLASAILCGHFEAGQLRHADIKESDRRLQCGDQFNCSQTVLSLADDGQLGPEFFEFLLPETGAAATHLPRAPPTLFASFPLHPFSF